MSSTLKEDKGKVTAEGGGGKVPLLPSLEKIPAGVEMALETYSLAQLRVKRLHLSIPTLSPTVSRWSRSGRCFAVKVDDEIHPFLL